MNRDETFEYDDINFESQLHLDFFVSFVQYVGKYVEVIESTIAKEKTRALEFVKLAHKHMDEEGLLKDKKISKKVDTILKANNLSEHFA